MDWWHLETVYKPMDKNFIGNSQHGFTKEKSCMANLTIFCGEMTVSLMEGKAVGGVYLHFIKAFDTQ